MLSLIYTVCNNVVNKICRTPCWKSPSSPMWVPYWTTQEPVRSMFQSTTWSWLNGKSQGTVTSWLTTCLWLQFMITNNLRLFWEILWLQRMLASNFERFGEILYNFTHYYCLDDNIWIPAICWHSAIPFYSEKRCDEPQGCNFHMKTIQ